MSRSVRFKLSGDRLQAALKFSNDLGIGLDEAAFRSLFLCIRQAYSGGTGNATGGSPIDTSTQADPAGDTDTVPAVPGSSAPLAEPGVVDGQVVE